MQTAQNMNNKNINVLIADDNEADLFIASSIFEASSINFDIKTVFDGEEVIDYLNECSQKKSSFIPDIIILDISMVLLDGLTTLEKIKQNKQFAHLPIFMLTGSCLEEELKKAKTLGASGFMTKGKDFALATLANYATIAQKERPRWVHISD